MTDENAFHFGVVVGLAAAGILQGLVFLVHGLGTWPGDTLNTSWVRGVAWVAFAVTELAAILLLIIAGRKAWWT